MKMKKKEIAPPPRVTSRRVAIAPPGGPCDLVGVGGGGGGRGQ